jgi:hypothetical protein
VFDHRSTGCRDHAELPTRKCHPSSAQILIVKRARARPLR